jgi:SOS response regulatory protein OraA/RecX
LEGKPPVDPYSLALKWLAVRELSEQQTRQRLRSRQVSPDTIEEVVTRLQAAGALDDHRTALACARTDALIKRHGRHRVVRQLESIGIDRDLARRTVDEVFEGVDEQDLMERALAGRMARRGRTISDPAEYRRLFSFLIRQGFEASAVNALLRSRARGAARSDEE